MRSAFCLRRHRLKANEKKTASQTVFRVCGNAHTYTQTYLSHIWTMESLAIFAFPPLSLCVFTKVEPEKMTRKTMRPSGAAGSETNAAFPATTDESKQANTGLTAWTDDCQTHEHSISGQPSLQRAPVNVSH